MMRRGSEFLMVITSVNFFLSSEFFPAEDSAEKRINIGDKHNEVYFLVISVYLEFVFPDQLPRLRKLVPESAVGHFFSPYIPQVSIS